MDQTIPLMTQAAIVKIAIESEERRSVELVQQRDYFVVFHALPTNIFANLPKGDALDPQQSALTFGDIFIQDVHAGWGS